MKSKKEGMAALERVVFFLWLSPLLAQGQVSNRGSRVDELVLASEAEVQDAFRTLQDGQTLSLEIAEARLNATVTLTASNIVIRGESGRSRIYCPSNGGAFVIKGINVTLLHLEFTKCRKRSVIEIIGRSGGQIPRNDSNNPDDRSRRKGNAIFIQDCLFFRNKGSQGTAINAQRSSLIIQNTTFRANKAKMNGGVVRMVRGDAVIEGSSFVRNDGGAVRMNDSDLVIESSSFIHNKALNGSGGAVEARSVTTLILSNSNFTGNRAEGSEWEQGRGGGVFVSPCSEMRIRSCSFEGNKADRDGGSLYAEHCPVAVRQSIFKDGTAGSRGGGIFAVHSDLILVKSNFADNTADGNGGGLCMNGGATLDVSGSNFTHQRSNQSGGAICTGGTRTLSVTDSSFIYNSAQLNGGAISSTSASLTIVSSQFYTNDAENAGGAVSLSEDGSKLIVCPENSFESNRAEFGGTLSLTASATLDLCPDRYGKEPPVVLGNTAFRGGGLYCSSCGLNVAEYFRFEQNVAAEFGGGAYVENALWSRIDGDFKMNVAAFGGGLYLTDSESVELHVANFTDNHAIDGGGLYIASRYHRTERYELYNVKLLGNRAMNRTSLSTDELNSAVLRWQEEQTKKSSERESQRLEPREEIQGRGGGAFIALRNTREDSSVGLRFRGVVAENNSANVGGGIYFDNWNRTAVTEDCRDAGRSRVPCLWVKLEGVRLIRNTALFAAGGFYVRYPNRLQTYGLTNGSVFSEDCFLELGEYVLCLEDNRLLDDDSAGQGQQRGTGAWRLELANLKGSNATFQAGEMLAIRRSTDEQPQAESIEVLVKDALDRHITRTSDDSELSVVLESDRISGSRHYKANKGTITINSTVMIGVDISDTLRIRSDDDRQLSVAINFSMLPCPDAELPNESGSGCFRCSANDYSFYPNVDQCRKCEDHAQCSGTPALVPNDGYWHSTPFGPFMRRCPVEKACSYYNRTGILTQYYTADLGEKLKRCNSTMHADLANCSDGYLQCATGYEGVLCGTCSNGYGHLADGECSACKHSRTQSILLTLLSTTLLFLALAIKTCLANREVEEYVSELEKPNPSAPVQLTRAHAFAQTSQRGRQLIPIRGNRQVPASPPKSLTDATALLVSTYNVLFNYLQLSTIALSLDVNWTTEMKYLRFVGGVIGRVMLVEFSPLDCTFSDKDSDLGIPNSIVVLWLRVSAPFFAMGFYVVLSLLKKFIKDGELTIPPLKSTFLVVYLAYCIDIVQYLLQAAFSCSIIYFDSPNNNHDYADFELPDFGNVWMRDTSVMCWRGQHLTSALLAVFCLLLCFAVVVHMAIVLRQGKKEENLKDPEFVRSHGVLFTSYKKEGLALHWEAVITVRKMLLAAIGVYFSHKEISGIQIIFLATVVFVAIVLHRAILPFHEVESEAPFPRYAGNEVWLLVWEDWRRRWAGFNQSVTQNGMEGASLWMSLCLFLVAGCLGDGKATHIESNILRIACFGLNVSFILFMLYRLWYGLHHYLDALATKKDLFFTGSSDADEDQATYLPIKVWAVIKTSEAWERLKSFWTNWSQN